MVKSNWKLFSLFCVAFISLSVNIFAQGVSGENKGGKPILPPIFNQTLPYGISHSLINMGGVSINQKRELMLLFNDSRYNCEIIDNKLISNEQLKVEGVVKFDKNFITKNILSTNIGQTVTCGNASDIFYDGYKRYIAINNTGIKTNVTLGICRDDNTFNYLPSDISLFNSGELVKWNYSNYFPIMNNTDYLCIELESENPLLYDGYNFYNHVGYIKSIMDFRIMENTCWQNEIGNSCLQYSGYEYINSSEKTRIKFRAYYGWNNFSSSTIDPTVYFKNVSEYSSTSIFYQRIFNMTVKNLDDKELILFRGEFWIASTTVYLDVIVKLNNVTITERSFLSDSLSNNDNYFSLTTAYLNENTSNQELEVFARANGLGVTTWYSRNLVGSYTEVPNASIMQERLTEYQLTSSFSSYNDIIFDTKLNEKLLFISSDDFKPLSLIRSSVLSPVYETEYFSRVAREAKGINEIRGMFTTKIIPNGNFGNKTFNMTGFSELGAGKINRSRIILIPLNNYFTYLHSTNTTSFSVSDSAIHNYNELSNSLDSFNDDGLFIASSLLQGVSSGNTGVIEYYFNEEQICNVRERIKQTSPPSDIFSDGCIDIISGFKREDNIRVIISKIGGGTISINNSNMVMLYKTKDLTDSFNCVYENTPDIYLTDKRVSWYCMDINSICSNDCKTHIEKDGNLISVLPQYDLISGTEIENSYSFDNNHIVQVEFDVSDLYPDEEYEFEVYCGECKFESDIMLRYNEDTTYKVAYYEIWTGRNFGYILVSIFFIAIVLFIVWVLN